MIREVPSLKHKGCYADCLIITGTVEGCDAECLIITGGLDGCHAYCFSTTGGLKDVMLTASLSLEVLKFFTAFNNSSGHNLKSSWRLHFSNIHNHINLYLKWVQVLFPPPHHLMEMDRPFSQVNHCIYPPPQFQEEPKDYQWTTCLLYNLREKLPENIASSAWHVIVICYTHIIHVVITHLPVLIIT